VKGKTVYKCHVCGKHFYDKEEVYLISNHIIVEAESYFGEKTAHWRFVREDEDKIERIELWFHRKCFKYIAGEEYLSKEKG
jgi:hypothetical protein